MIMVFVSRNENTSFEPIKVNVTWGRSILQKWGFESKLQQQKDEVPEGIRNEAGL